MPFIQVANPWDQVAQAIAGIGPAMQQKKIQDQALQENKIKTILDAIPSLQQNPALASNPAFQSLFGGANGGVNPGVVQKTPQQQLADLVANTTSGLATSDPDAFKVTTGIATPAQGQQPAANLKVTQNQGSLGDQAVTEGQLKTDNLLALTPRQLAAHFGFTPDATLTAQDAVQLQQSAFQSDALRAAHASLMSDPTFRKMSGAEQAGILPFFITRDQDQSAWDRTSLQVGDKNSQALKLIFDGAEQEYRTKMADWQKNTQQIQNALLLSTGNDKKRYQAQLDQLNAQMPRLDYKEYADRLGVDFNQVTSAVVKSLARQGGTTTATSTAGGRGTVAPTGISPHVQAAASLLKSGIPASDTRVSNILDSLTPAEIGQVEGLAGVKLQKAP